MTAAVHAIAARLQPNLDPNLVSTTTGRIPAIPAYKQSTKRATIGVLTFPMILSCLRPGVAQVNQHPDVAECLRTCVAAGGSLMVTSIADHADLEMVDQLFSRRDAAQSEPSTMSSRRVWWGTASTKVAFCASIKIYRCWRVSSNTA